MNHVHNFITRPPTRDDRESGEAKLMKFLSGCQVEVCLLDICIHVLDIDPVAYLGEANLLVYCIPEITRIYRIKNAANVQ